MHSDPLFAFLVSSVPAIFSLSCRSSRMGVIGRYNLEIAELYFSSLKEHALTVDMVQVDDD